VTSTREGASDVYASLTLSKGTTRFFESSIGFLVVAPGILDIYLVGLKPLGN